MARIPPPLDPKYFLPFSLYALLIAAAGALAVETIKHDFEFLWHPALWFLGSLGLLAVLAYFYDRDLRAALQNWRSRPTRLGLDFHKRVALSKALVVLVSRGDGAASARHSIAHHKPALKHLYIVHSFDADSKAAAEAIAAENRGSTEVSLSQVRDLFRVEEAARHFDGLRAQAKRDGFEEAGLMFDFTGLPKPVGVGMVISGLAGGTRIQYMEPVAFLPDGKPDPAIPSIPVEMHLTYELDAAAS